MYFTEHTLVETADQFVKLYGGELLCIDEIHKYKNWNQELKNIYDSYPNLKILFSGSSSIDLIKGKYDLSRRVILRQMYGFSFREFLEIQTGNTYPTMKLEDILDPSKHIDSEIGKTEKLLGYLHEYWQKGYYPTSQAIPVYEAFRDTLIGTIDKTIFEDISTFYTLKTENLDTLKKIIYFFATSLPGSVSINKLANSLGKDHATITEYVQILRDTGLLRFLLIDKYGHALVRNAEKIYLDNTNLLYAINNQIGKEIHAGSVRELFVVSGLENAGYPVLYSKTGDISCEGNIFEIGGANKTATQIKDADKAYVVKDDILYASARTIPLYVFGFLS
ncbi:MAG: hypothetical protein ACD_48C00263G0002 [uncultured bacterium]|nr:MAG: hypothetical protein ACD_48C00263G0002 [uncultured bacterium]